MLTLDLKKDLKEQFSPLHNTRLRKGITLMQLLLYIFLIVVQLWIFKEYFHCLNSKVRPKFFVCMSGTGFIEYAVLPTVVVLVSVLDWLKNLKISIPKNYLFYIFIVFTLLYIHFAPNVIDVAEVMFIIATVVTIISGFELRRLVKELYSYT